MRSGSTIPTYSDLKDELENYHDEDKSELVTRESPSRGDKGTLAGVG